MNNLLSLNPSLLLWLCSEYIAPANLTRFLCTNRRLRLACFADISLQDLWLSKYKSIMGQHRTYEGLTSLLEVFLGFYDSEQSIIAHLSTVQSTPYECIMRCFASAGHHIEHQYDIYALMNISYGPLSACLVLLVTYRRLEQGISTAASVAALLHYIRSHIDVDDYVEVSYSEWGSHNQYGFRTRDVRRSIIISVSALGQMIADGGDARNNNTSLYNNICIVFTLMYKAMNLSGSISCLSGATVSEWRQGNQQARMYL